MELITQAQADEHLEALKNRMLFAQDPNSPRNVLIRDIRAAHAASGKDAPVAAVLTKAELVERNLWRSEGKRQGPSIKAGRANAKVPSEVAIVRTLEDKERVLIVLRDAETS